MKSFDIRHRLFGGPLDTEDFQDDESIDEPWSPAGRVKIKRKEKNYEQKRSRKNGHRDSRRSGE